MPMNRWLGIFLVALMPIFSVTSAASREQSAGTAASASDATSRAPDYSRFKSGVDLVSLDVCVKDSTGRLLNGLTADNFLVSENGKPQRISFVLPSGTVPLTALLLIDVSHSMYGPKLKRALEAATQFAELLGPEDRLEILAFNRSSHRIHTFGDSAAQVRRALSSSIGAILSSSTGTTALYDALLVSANDLLRARDETLQETREVIIVLSDGEDTSSRIGFEEVVPVIRRSGALVYSLSLRANDRGEWLGASWPLSVLARDTGARAVGIPSLDALTELYGDIYAEARHLYRIGYVSNDERRDGQWRTVSVRVRSRDAHARTRAGYYASRQGSAGAQR